ncbi:cytochrome P450 [Imleria badia]|nr:cytochrome P450 [Imleria badia]
MISAEGWATKDVIEVPSVHELTFKFTLIIIASVGFGFPFTWANPPAQEGEIGVQECLEIITKTKTFAITAPTWAWKLLFPWIRRIRRAYDTMRAFMRTIVSTIRETIRSEAEDTATKRARDLFSLLIQASEDAGGKIGLNDNELNGNVFSFLFAGHETTAHTLAAILAFLALDSDLQDELVAQVQELTRGRDDNTSLVSDYGKLDKVLAAFYEGFRMFRVFLVREAKHDTALDISDGDEPRMLSVKKGNYVVVDMIGVQYNPRHFSDPDEFRASRWYRKVKDSDEKDEKEKYTAFSIGFRSCLGRKFASTEGVCFLTSLLRDWRVEPLLAMQPNGQVETADEWRGRVLQANIESMMCLLDL